MASARMSSGKFSTQREHIVALRPSWWRLWENSGRKKLAKTTSPKPPSQRPEGHIIQKTRFIPSSVPAIHHYWSQAARIASLGVLLLLF
ncbi:hypothetical protein DTO166G4_7929 [Paecilomyces variotii]|nr:hypothetical protein DTO166G4_7929 [Paecilomyces variotii]KAJ9228125.1 hypothetical protein DTO166G5_8840 [Paecilomyces variotii]KAJ9265487.1 hypothetical protein DTO212C5_6680 [Paecilomyces variotii]KAJ9283681.1 hypothetical protein DTO021C3_8752 [Paecilomyces variotii]KAJ9307604.1 hypothetical protein DTO217A2_2838 [Paecilomyces variotii]